MTEWKSIVWWEGLLRHHCILHLPLPPSTSGHNTYFCSPFTPKPLILRGEGDRWNVVAKGNMKIVYDPWF